MHIQTRQSMPMKMFLRLSCPEPHGCHSNFRPPRTHLLVCTVARQYTRTTHQSPVRCVQALDFPSRRQRWPAGVPAVSLAPLFLLPLWMRPGSGLGTARCCCIATSPAGAVSPPEEEDAAVAPFLPWPCSTGGPGHQMRLDLEFLHPTMENRPIGAVLAAFLSPVLGHVDAQSLPANGRCRLPPPLRGPDLAVLLACHLKMEMDAQVLMPPSLRSHGARMIRVRRRSSQNSAKRPRGPASRCPFPSSSSSTPGPG